MAPVAAGLSRNGWFSAVAKSGSAFRANTLLEVRIPQLYGDFRIPARPRAVLTMQFSFFEASNGVPGERILQHEYSRIIPLKAATAPALMEGWNEELSDILSDVSSDLRRFAPDR